MTVAVNWFEIPVTNMGRAVEFYGAVLNTPLDTMDGPDGHMHVFPGADGAAGTLIQADDSISSGGVLIYLHTDDIDAALQRATSAGGAVEQEKTSIGPFGFIGRFRDTEGNSVALHTPSDM